MSMKQGPAMEFLLFSVNRLRFLPPSPAPKNRPEKQRYGQGEDWDEALSHTLQRAKHICRHS